LRLADARLPVVVHETVQQDQQDLRKVRPLLPSYERYSGLDRRQSNDLPAARHDSAALRGRARTRTAILTGWAVEAGAGFVFKPMPRFR